MTVGPVTQLHRQVVDVLLPLGLGAVVDGTTAAAGPCYAVAPPALAGQEAGVCGPVWTLRCDVLVIPASARNRGDLLGMVDAAAAALATLGEVTGSPGTTPYLDADVDTYTLTLEV